MYKLILYINIFIFISVNKFLYIKQLKIFKNLPISFATFFYNVNNF